MSDTVIPEVLWAQRSNADDADKNVVYLTINAPDVPAENLKLELTNDKLVFEGANKNKKFAVTLEFFADIIPEKSARHHSARGVEMKLIKAEKKAEFWPRLLKENKRQHFLKTDFDKWVDEDEQEEAADPDLAGMDMGGMGGMPGMGGMDMASMMAQMGGGAGGMPDFSNMGGAGDDSDDDLPELEANEVKPKDGEGEQKAGEGEQKAEGEPKAAEEAK